MLLINKKEWTVWMNLKIIMLKEDKPKKFLMHDGIFIKK